MKVSTQKVTTYILELDEYEAAALTSLLYGKDWQKVNDTSRTDPKYFAPKGNGVLHALYHALRDQGATVLPVD